MKLERELGHDPEVSSASAAQRPKEVRVFGRARVEFVAAGVHEMRGEEVVAGKPELARREPVPAAEREPGDADRLACACGQREFLREERFRHVAEQRASADARGLVRRVDDHGVHLPHVDNKAGARRKSLVRMPAAVAAERKLVLPRPLHREAHAVRRPALRDDRRPHGRAQIEGQQIVESRIAGPQDLAIGRRDDELVNGIARSAHTRAGPARLAAAQTGKDRSFERGFGEEGHGLSLG